MYADVMCQSKTALMNAKEQNKSVIVTMLEEHIAAQVFFFHTEQHGYTLV
jgi:primosomal protein N''